MKFLALLIHLLVYTSLFLLVAGHSVIQESMVLYPTYNGINYCFVRKVLCRKNIEDEMCNVDITWAYDEKAQKCYHVSKNKDPCGNFDSENSCYWFCSHKHDTKNKIDKKNW